MCTFFLFIFLTCPEEDVTIPNPKRSWQERQKGVAADYVNPYVCVCVFACRGVCVHMHVCACVSMCAQEPLVILCFDKH